MMFKFAIIAAASLGMASHAFAGPVPDARLMGPEASKASAVHVVGSKNRYYKRKRYERDCTPINGPYGYYGNPFCEGGYTRDGEAGGYEIDLTRYLRDRRYRDDSRY